MDATHTADPVVAFNIGGAQVAVTPVVVDREVMTLEDAVKGSQPARDRPTAEEYVLDMSVALSKALEMVAEKGITCQWFGAPTTDPGASTSYIINRLNTDKDFRINRARLPAELYTTIKSLSKWQWLFPVRKPVVTHAEASSRLRYPFYDCLFIDPDNASAADAATADKVLYEKLMTLRDTLLSRNVMGLHLHGRQTVDVFIYGPTLSNRSRHNSHRTKAGHELLDLIMKLAATDSEGRAIGRDARDSSIRYAGIVNGDPGAVALIYGLCANRQKSVDPLKDLPFDMTVHAIHATTIEEAVKTLTGELMEAIVNTTRNNPTLPLEKIRPMDAILSQPIVFLQEGGTLSFPRNLLDPDTLKTT